MRKLVFTLLLFVASSLASADDLCMSVIPDPDNRPLDRDYLRIVAPNPGYPSNLLADGSEGFVDIKFEITTAGTVRNPIVVYSVPPGLFDGAALEAVLKFRYKPRIIDGAPVVVEGVPTRITFSTSAQDKPDEQKPARQKQAQAVSKAVYSQIEKAQELVDAQDYDGALRILNRLYNPDKLTEYEQVNVLNYQAFVYYNMDDIPNAMRAYERQLLIPSLEPQTAKQTTYTLAQLNMMEERYGRALELLNKLFLLETNPAPEPFILKAQVLYQLQRYAETVEPIENAMQIAAMREKPIKEDWYVLLNFAYFQQENYQMVRGIQKILLANWPKERYGYSLAGAYKELGELQAMLDTSKEVSERWPSEKNSYGLARLYIGTGDKKKALALFRELLASWPETDYMTELHLAAAEGDTILVAELLTNGVNVNAQSDDDRTPLHWAVEFGQAEAIRMLIDANADVNARTESDWTPLHAAAKSGEASIVEMLIAAGAHVSAKAEKDMTPLHAAMESGDASVIEMLIVAGADIDEKTENGLTVLHRAAQKRYSLIVEMLIAAGADVNAKTETHGTALHLAAGNSEASIVEMLIAAGADVNAKMKANSTALHLAAANSEASIVELLISAGADVNAKTERGSTPLHAAAKKGNASVVEILIAAGADLNAKAEDDWTPLSYAARDGHTAIAYHLIDQGAKIAGAKVIADSGSANAQYLLGSLYAQGLGVRQRDSRAAKWYRAAAEKDHADAAYALGEMYFDGSGIKSDVKQAAQWFQAAAYQGHRNAQMKLSELYQNGVGVAKDPTEASMWSCLAGV